MASKSKCNLEIIMPDGSRHPVTGHTPRYLEYALNSYRVVATVRDTKSNADIQVEFRLEPVIRQTLEDFLKASSTLANTSANYTPRYPSQEATTLLDAHLNLSDPLSRWSFKRLRKLIVSGYLDPSLNSLTKNYSLLRATRVGPSHLTQKGRDFVSKLMARKDLPLDDAEIKSLLTDNLGFKVSKGRTRWEALGIIGSAQPNPGYSPEMDKLTSKIGYYFQEKAFKSLSKNLISLADNSAGILNSPYSTYRHEEHKNLISAILKVLPASEFSVVLATKNGATISQLLPKTSNSKRAS